MSNKMVSELLEEVHKLRESLTNHLIECSGIKVQLKINTWLTGTILAALLTNFVTQYFK